MRDRELRDQASEYAAAWAEFAALDRVAPHRADWAAWAAGRGQHTLFMALVRHPHVVAAIGDVQRELAHVRGLELHAGHFFHISIQSCGFDQALSIDGERVAAGLHEVAPFQVQLGGVNAFHSAVFLETHSGGGLLAVRRALRSALGHAIETIDPFDGFLFHLTLGYLGADTDLGHLRTAITELRERRAGCFNTEQIDLVQVPTDQRVPYPELESVRSFRLGRR